MLFEFCLEVRVHDLISVTSQLAPVDHQIECTHCDEGSNEIVKIWVELLVCGKFVLFEEATSFDVRVLSHFTTYRID